MIVAVSLLRFVLLIAVQVLLLDQMDLANGWVVPYLYILFLLMLPFELPTWAVLLIGFATGATMDFFSSTPGMHAGACTVMAFTRTGILRLLRPRDGYDFGVAPTLQGMGWSWFLAYIALMVPVHHLWLFFTEVFRFDRLLETMGRGLLSALLTIVLMVLAQLLFIRPDRART
jgi:rod shape-determining protein MreD